MPALVSIVTPSFMQAPFLRETIESVLHQEGAPFEYIIIDGSSTDASIEIICEYESRLAYWTSEPDKGQADAINKGWQRCSGDIFCYLNSDDMFAKETLHIVTEFFDAHPDVDIVYGDRAVIDEHSRVLEVVVSPPFSVDTQVAICLPQECVFFRRRALEQVGLLNTALHYLMDYDLWLRMLGAGLQFQHLPRVLAKYRLHRAAKSTSQRVNFWREYVAVIEIYLESDARVTKHFADATRSQIYFQAGIELACGDARVQGAAWVNQSLSYSVLPFGSISQLATRAANIITNALLWSERMTPPAELFDWLYAQIPNIPARAEIVSALQKARKPALGEYFLAKAFDDYAHGKYKAVARNVLTSAQYSPAALKNRGAWVIATKSIVKTDATR